MARTLSTEMMMNQLVGESLACAFYMPLHLLLLYNASSQLSLILCTSNDLSPIGRTREREGERFALHILTHTHHTYTHNLIYDPICYSPHDSCIRFAAHKVHHLKHKLSAHNKCKHKHIHTHSQSHDVCISQHHIHII